MSETTPYYNTTNLVNAELFAAIDAAKIQNDRVMLIYKVKNRPMSASEVWQIYKTWFNNAPLTSIRRSISTLVKSGKINYTSETKIGLYGRAERIWSL